MLDATRLLEDLGGPTEVARQLTGLGHPIGAGTVFAWKYRASIPSRWLGPLLAVARRKDIHMVVEDYIG